MRRFLFAFAAGLLLLLSPQRADAAGRDVTSLVCTPFTNGDVRCDWALPSGMAFMDHRLWVYRNGVQLCYWAWSGDQTNGPTSCTDSARAWGTTNTYMVVLQEGWNWGLPLSAGVQVIATTPPSTSVITGLTPTPDGGVTVSWSAATGATTYSLIRTLEGGTGVLLAGYTTSPVTLTNLGANLKYYFAVMPVAGNVAALPSTAVLVRTAPAVPAPYKTTGGYRQFSFAWTPITGATAYQYTVGGTAASTANTTVSMNSLSDNTAYTITVRAQNSDGTYSSSSSPLVITTAPAAPTGLTVVAGDRQLTVQWSASAGAGVSYDVYDVTATRAFRGNTAGTSYNVVGLSVNELHRYVVVAKNTNGSSADSNTASGTTLSSATNALVLTPGYRQIGVSWTSVPGATGYNVYRGDTRVSANNATTTFTDTGLSDNTDYTYSTETINAGGTSARSATQTARTAPAKAVMIGAATGGHRQNTLTWTSSAGTASNVIEVSADLGAHWSTAATVGAVTTTTVSSLLDCKEYRWRVVSKAAEGTASAPSDPVTGYTFPPVPTGVSVNVVDGDTLRVSWVVPNACPTPPTVKYQRATAAGGPFGALSAGTTGLTADDDVPSTANTYYYRAITELAPYGTSLSSALASNNARTPGLMRMRCGF